MNWQVECMDELNKCNNNHLTALKLITFLITHVYPFLGYYFIFLALHTDTLQSTEKNSVVNIDHQCVQRKLHFSPGWCPKLLRFSSHPVLHPQLGLSFLVFISSPNKLYSIGNVAWTCWIVKFKCILEPWAVAGKVLWQKVDPRWSSSLSRQYLDRGWGRM